MYKKTYILFFLLVSIIAIAQKSSEQFPIFPNCENKNGIELENCFNYEVQNFVYTNFKILKIGYAR